MPKKKDEESRKEIRIALEGLQEKEAAARLAEDEKRQASPHNLVKEKDRSESKKDESERLHSQPIKRGERRPGSRFRRWFIGVEFGHFCQYGC